MNNTDYITLFMGAGLSLLFTFFPPAQLWLERQTPNQRRAIMALLLLVISIAVNVAACNGLLGICEQDWFMHALVAFLGSVAVNQGVFSLSPKPEHSYKFPSAGG